MDKQFKYAEKKNIPFVVIIGSKEIEMQEAVIKELSTGEQQTVGIGSLPQYFINKQVTKK